MQSKLIEKIHNNDRSLMLMRSSGIFQVTEKYGTTYKTTSFETLVEALNYFNELSEGFRSD